MTDPTRLREAPAKPTAAKPAQFQVQFFLKHGTMITWAVPSGQDFSFASLVQNIRSAGYFLHFDVYVPADEIACIGLAGAPGLSSASIQQPAHPTRQ